MTTVKLMVVSTSVWISFAVWFFVAKPSFISSDDAATVLLIGIVPAVLGSVATTVLVRAFVAKASGRRLFFFRLLSALTGTVVWFLSVTGLVNVVAAVAVNLGVADQVNNAAQFFYAYDGHFFVVLCVLALSGVAFRAAASQ